MSDLLIGADPELFVKKGTRFISGHIFECGTKDEPQDTKHGTVQVDGLALEFNVVPSANKKMFLRNLRGVMRDLEQIVHKKDRECELAAVPTVHFGSDYIASCPLHIRSLGCTPDFDAYSADENTKPDAEVPFRTGAGHIHIGWTNGAVSIEHFMRCCEITRELDFYLGLPSLSWDGDAERRNLYGKAGSFRPKHYGVEYRVLSNAWVKSDDTAGFVFNQSKKAWTNWMNGKSLFREYGTFAQDIINHSVQDWRERAPGLEARIIS